MIHDEFQPDANQPPAQTEQVRRQIPKRQRSAPTSPSAARATRDAQTPAPPPQLTITAAGVIAACSQMLSPKLSSFRVCPRGSTLS
jgi:hypothetical protein